MTAKTADRILGHSKPPYPHGIGNHSSCDSGKIGRGGGNISFGFFGSFASWSASTACCRRARPSADVCISGAEFLTSNTSVQKSSDHAAESSSTRRFQSPSFLIQAATVCRFSRVTALSVHRGPQMRRHQALSFSQATTTC